VDDIAEEAAWALAGMTVATVGGYLGGHLVSVRKVSSSDPTFDAVDMPLQ
jgi:hypothetical protein